MSKPYFYEDIDTFIGSIPPDPPDSHRVCIKWGPLHMHASKLLSECDAVMLLADVRQVASERAGKSTCKVLDPWRTPSGLVTRTAACALLDDYVYKREQEER